MSVAEAGATQKTSGVRWAFAAMVRVGVVAQVAEYYRGTDLVVIAEGRIGGLRLVANDRTFRTGAGPLVSGGTVAPTMP
ncbi:hypothetical protein ACWD04_11400 [Streptomyces sp. NPDC002911]